MPFQKQADRQLFYRCGNQVLLMFNRRSDPPSAEARRAARSATRHATGEGHVCFRASAADIEVVENAARQAKGVEIESDFVWPSGGRSIYFRDPAGNCLEFAEPKIWGLN